jgi:ATP-dependent DNA ligase
LSASVTSSRVFLEERKGTLAGLLIHRCEGIAFNQRYAGERATIFKHACGLGCEGIVSKRLGSAYCSGSADCLVKVRREAEEDWDRRRELR